MANFSPLSRSLLCLASTVLGGSQYLPAIASHHVEIPSHSVNYSCLETKEDPNFLVVAGGGTPKNNEIALEKNVLYFQRTLNVLGYNPAQASIFFANGNDGQATIRYLDEQQNQRFKVPEIPYLGGAATVKNLQNWLSSTVGDSDNSPIFFYFTGHGTINKSNIDNNALVLWDDQRFTVQQLASQLDQMPQNTKVVTMMAQCFAGSFANFIYEGGDPNQPVALQTRCGFFATVSTRPSVGCTPLVNEADYKDYSSSFFAGLSGRSRTGVAVPSADYDHNGTVSYAEAHAFAKVDEQTTDLPLSTSEAWLQKKVSGRRKGQILGKPISELLATARAEQQYVVKSLASKFNFDLQQSYVVNLKKVQPDQINTDVTKAYLGRLFMEIINIGTEQQMRAEGDTEISILNRLIECEASSW